jgi:prepilin peptidase CpaA
MSLLSAVLVFLPMSFLAARKIVGGGDAKMMTAVTFLFPPERVALVVLIIALAGGILGLAYLAAGYAFKAWGRARAPGLADPGFLRAEAARALAGAPLPFAFAIFAGVACTVFLELFSCFSATSYSTFCSL